MQSGWRIRNWFRLQRQKTENKVRQVGFQFVSSFSKWQPRALYNCPSSIAHAPICALWLDPSHMPPSVHCGFNLGCVSNLSHKIHFSYFLAFRPSENPRKLMCLDRSQDLLQVLPTSMSGLIGIWRTIGGNWMDFKTYKILWHGQGFMNCSGRF